MANCGADLAEPIVDCAKGDVAGCARAAVRKCDADPDCGAFSLSPAWNRAQQVKLKSADGPWLPASTSPMASVCNMPCAAVHPNGTLFVLCGNGNSITRQ
eukprot:gene10079-2461_t